MFGLTQLPRNLAAIKADFASAELRVRKDVLADMRRSQGDDSERLERIQVLQKFLSDESTQLRSDALLALCDYQAKSSLPRIIARLKDPEIRVRQMALLAIGELSEGTKHEALSAIRPFLRARDPRLRYQALVALAQLNPSEARPELIAGISDNDAEIAALSVRLLGEVSDSSWEKDREIVEGLKQAAKHSDARVRVAAQLLGGDFKIDMPRTEISALVNRTRRAPEPTDELWAIELAFRYDLRGTMPALRRRAYGLIGISFDPARFMALVVLGAFGDAAALSKLEKQLASRKVVNRHAILEAIVSLKLASMKPLVDKAVAKGVLFEEPLLKSYRALIRKSGK